MGDLRLGSIDGTVTRMPDTPANRAAFGSTGTGDDSAPYPQLRGLLISDASTRGALGVVTGPAGGDKAEAEQKLLDRALQECQHLFTPGRLWVLDRNFPGVARIKKMLATGTHVLIRVKSDIQLRRWAGSCPTGPTWQNSPAAASPCRPGHRVLDRRRRQNVPELFCLITDLHDHGASRGDARRRLQVAVGRVGDRAAGSQVRHQRRRALYRADVPVKSPQMVRQEHAAWITATELVRGTARAAARRAAPAGKGRRAGQPVHPREISFTAARRAASPPSATAPPPPACPAHHRRRLPRRYRRPSADAGSIDRNRHRDHKTKARQPFQKAPRETPTRTAAAKITICCPAA